MKKNSITGQKLKWYRAKVEAILQLPTKYHRTLVTALTQILLFSQILHFNKLFWKKTILLKENIELSGIFDLSRWKFQTKQIIQQTCVKVVKLKISNKQIIQQTCFKVVKVL
jgi:hypothetical protein